MHPPVIYLEHKIANMQYIGTYAPVYLLCNTGTGKGVGGELDM